MIKKLQLLCLCLCAVLLNTAQGQSNASPGLTNKTDGYRVSGQFVNFPVSKTSFVHYTIVHDPVSKAVQVELLSSDLTDFTFNIVDKDRNNVNNVGVLKNGRFYTSVDVSKLNAGGDLAIVMFSPQSGPVTLFSTTFH